MDVLDLAHLIVDIVSDVKAEDIVLLDIQEITTISDYFVICHATSERQLKAIIDRVTLTLKDDHKIRPFGVEGDANGGWVLLDYSGVVLHVFSPEMREYYDLEAFWGEGKTLVRMQ